MTGLFCPPGQGGRRALCGRESVSAAKTVHASLDILMRLWRHPPSEGDFQERWRHFAPTKSFSGLTTQAKPIGWLLMLLLAGLEGAAPAHELITTKITWTREVSRIFFRRCTSCHHQDGSSFDLSTYEKARPWAEAIKEEVLERRMPPWGAVKGFGDFHSDGALSETEIAIISSWAEGGAPKGDLALLPEYSGTREEPEAPGTGRSLVVNGHLTLKSPVSVKGLRPDGLPEGATSRLIAERPDGTVEPLIWFYKYAPRFLHSYYFKTALKFSVGTRIRMQPEIGSVTLLLNQR